MNTAQTETELILPGQARGADGFCALGYICRAALALFCTLSFSVFILDGLGIEPELASAVIPGLLAAIYFSLMGISKRCFFIMGGAAAAVLALFCRMSESELPQKLWLAFAALWNSFFNRLEALGYTGMKNYILNHGYSMRRLGMTEASALRISLALVIALLAAIFCACILRRVRLVPLTAVGTAVCTIFLYYGMNDSNLGFALIIASLCGVLALAGYDRIFSDRRAVKTSTGLDPKRRADRAEFVSSRRHSSALGGFTGLGTAMLALILLVIPIGVREQMSEIPSIAVPAAKLESFIVSVMNGQSPDVGSLIFSGVTSIDSRETAMSARSYTGEHIFTVASEIKLPVYLRCWVGTDYYGDSWHAPGYDRIAAYKTSFGEGFTSELLTSELLRAFDPSLVGLSENEPSRSHTELGYVTTRIDIRKLKPTANLVFLPSYTDMRSGLLTYGSLERSQSGFSSYSDGIYTSTGYLFLNDYSTIANLPLLRDPDFADNLYKLVSDIARERRLIERAYYQSDVRAYADSTAGSLSYRFLYEMDADERSDVLAAFANADVYRDFVYATYLGSCESFESIEKLARTIVFGDMPDYARMNEFAARHTKVMKIIQYLSENMTYSLNPKAPDPDREYSNAAESFLFDTKEGYCVQFATAATMLVRALGIPARYAEGYIADSFERTRLEDAPAVYRSTVADSNAHAWIEVYYDGYGWIQYEATTPYMSDMYEGSIPTSSTPEPSPVEPLPEETFPEETAPEILPEPVVTPVSPKRTLPAWIIRVVAAAALTAAAVIILRARAAMAERRFDELTRRALSGDDPRSAAKELNAKIFRLLKLCGLAPAAGEQQSEFAVRVDSLIGSVMPEYFTNVSRAMLAVEFSPGLSAADARMISGYCSALRAYSLRGTGLSTRLWRKYILAL